MFRSHTEVYRPLVKPPAPILEEWFSCDLCTEDDTDLRSLWRSEIDLELHRKEVHFNHLSQQMKTYKDRFCTVCMTLQDSPDTLITHIKTRHLFSSANARRVEREMFVCSHCGHVFFNKQVLEAHILYLHMWKGPLRMKRKFTCPKCKKMVRLKLMWFHMQQHDIPSASVCDICLTSCQTTHDLMQHLKTHPMHYKCEICSYHTTKDELFQRHLDIHRENSAGDMCGKKCKKDVFVKSIKPCFQKYNMHHNIKGLILPEIVLICVLCREICRNKKEMWEHVSRDHMRPLRAARAAVLRCACGDAFPSRVLLRHHVFKLRGAHRECTDDNPTAVQDQLSVETNEHKETSEHIKTGEHMKTYEHNKTNELKRTSGHKQTDKHNQMIIEHKETSEDKKTGEHNKTNEQNPPTLNTVLINEHNSRHDASKQIEMDWQVDPSEDVELTSNETIGSTIIGENVTLTAVDVSDAKEAAAGAGGGGVELVYVYAAVDDDEMGALDQDSEENAQIEF